MGTVKGRVVVDITMRNGPGASYRIGREPPPFGPQWPKSIQMLSFLIRSVSIVWRLTLKQPPDALQMHPGAFRIAFPHLPGRLGGDIR